MKINVTKQLMQVDGKNPIKHSDGEVATFRSIVGEVMSNRVPDDPRELKFSLQCFEIGKRIFESETAELSIKELGFIQERVAKFGYSHFVVGRINEVIESASPLAAVE